MRVYVDPLYKCRVADLSTFAVQFVYNYNGYHCVPMIISRTPRSLRNIYTHTHTSMRRSLRAYVNTLLCVYGRYVTAP